MANPAHLEVLKSGVEEWNAWIVQQRSNPGSFGTRHPGARLGVSGFWPDLSGANLADCDLYQGKTGEYFGGIDLLGADLSGANLQHTNLAWAGLTAASLRGADLTRANLNNATLHGANVSEAILRGATLGGATLLSASLARTDLSHAYLSETVFSDTDMTGVQGLGLCTYAGPCPVDARTLFGYELLPVAFLQGCGLPDRLIEYLPSMRTDALRFNSCFISYSSNDLDFAERLHADLRAAGIRCWFAPHDLGIGERTLDAIDQAVHVHDKLLLVCSEASIRSDWVEGEVLKAFAEERERKSLVLFPIRIDEAIMTTSEPWAIKLRNERNIGDCSNWRMHDAYKVAFDKILFDLQRR